MRNKGGINQRKGQSKTPMAKHWQ